MMEEREVKGLKLAPYNPTNIDAIEIVLNLLNIPIIREESVEPRNDIILYDLGCGDARLLIQACLRCNSSSLRCIGVEYDGNLVEIALRNIRNHEFDKVCSSIVFVWFSL